VTLNGHIQIKNSAQATIPDVPLLQMRSTDRKRSDLKAG